MRGLGYMAVSEMLKTMHENDLFDMLPDFSKVVHILSVTPVTYVVFCRRIIPCDAQIETYLRSTMGHQRVMTCK